MMYLEKLNHNADLSNLTKEEKGTICFEAVQTLSFATKRIDEAWREVGKLLSWIKKTKIYKFYSDDINGQMQTPVVTDDNREEILNAAEHLPLSGWKDTIREQKGKVLVEECSHDELENYGRCKACGKWIKC